MACALTACGPALGQLASPPASVDYIDYPKLPGKVQPLEWNEVPSWMALDMELRGRTENQTSLNSLSGNDQLYELTRVWGGLEVRPARWLTGYLQFMDTHALGLPLKYVAANMRDAFDDRQAYVKLHGKGLTLIAGRQELKYGSERIVGISDWTNNSRTWDGFLGRIGDKNRLDLFSTSVVTVSPTSLDKHGAGLTFHGAVGTITTWVPKMTVMPFVFVRTEPRVKSQQGLYGTETEVTPGAEVKGDAEGFFFDAVGALQRGSYSNNSIHSGAGYVKSGYFARHVPGRPRLLGEYDYATGNAHRNVQRMGTFDQQYPSNHNAFGLTDLFGFQNIRQERLNLDLAPAKKVTLLFQQEWLNAATTKDSIYDGTAGVLVAAPSGGFARSGLGREFDASGTYLYRQYLVMQAGVGHFSPDGALTENHHGAPLTLTYFSLTYRFSVNKQAPPP